MSVRGQAFTLEGFIASVVILSAVLFALQAIVITPTSSGQLDQEVTQNLKTQGRDILTASANNGTEDLSFLLRLFGNQTSGPAETWERGQNRQTGYGSDEPFAHRDTLLGNALNETFKQRGFSYNLVVEYLSATSVNETRTANIVFRGSPSEESVSVTYTIVLYDNQTLTGSPNSSASVDCTEYILENTTADRSNSADCYYAIPEARLYDDDSDGTDAEMGETGDSPIYNIVEVRVVIWG